MQSIEFSSVFHLFEFPSLNNSRTSDLHSFIFLLLFLQIFAIALNLSLCCCLRASYFLRSAFFIRNSRNLQRIFSERPVLRRSNSSSILLQLMTFSKCLPKFWKYKDLNRKFLFNVYRSPNSLLPHNYWKNQCGSGSFVGRLASWITWWCSRWCYSYPYRAVGWASLAVY